MSYLQNLGLRKPKYEKRPTVSVQGFDDQCWQGWESVCERLKLAISARKEQKIILALECYSGVLDNEIVPALKAGLDFDSFVQTEQSLFKDAEEIDALAKPFLGGDDPVFGYLASLKMKDFLNNSMREANARGLDAKNTGLHIVYGPGAVLCCDPDLIVYADMPRWEGQLRQRRNEVSNIGVVNSDLKATLQYKRSFFVDWRVCDKLKAESMSAWNFLLDTTTAGDPKLISGDGLRAGLAQTVKQPFRVMPFFDPGIWGGQWMKEICELPDGPPNYAWCFDCVPEENSLLLKFGGVEVEIPSTNLVLRHPKELLGEPVYGLCGAWFPIRFDLLDTMDGGNLSFQVHPIIDYAREEFGLAFTQDESYYILDAKEDACVYLGLKNNIDPEKMIEDLEAAQKDPELGFDDNEHVAKWPARKHDHFLIPAGTCHCSGKNSMVLEISHTPYIFTFKLWDWNRLGMDGKPRPINIERGRGSILWDRTEDWIEENLINHTSPVAEGVGWREEKTGLYKSEMIETRRHWFTDTVLHNTNQESVHVLNLVQGEEAIVESPGNAFEPFVVHYAETFVIPSEVGEYTIRPHGASARNECATLKAFVRTKG